MDPWQSGYVEANSVRLYYTRTGGARPPIVLAHGVTDDGLCWTPVAEVLAPDYDVIMVDARGHGRSSAPESGYDPLTQAGDLYEVIRALGLNKPIVLGHSMGAMTALALAALYPDVPRAVLLEDPPAWWDPNGLDPAAAEDMRIWALGLKTQTREELIAWDRAQNLGWSDAELSLSADAKLLFSVKVIDPIFRDNPVIETSQIENLRHIACPLLVITGDPAKAILKPEDVAMLRTYVPHLREANIPGAGHCIHRDQFTGYMAAVRPFLAQVDT